MKPSRAAHTAHERAVYYATVGDKQAFDAWRPEVAGTDSAKRGAFFTSLSTARQIAAVTLKHFNLPKHATVIDACAGIGVLAYALLETRPDLHMTCVEIDKQSAEAGARLVRARWHNVSVRAYAQPAGFVICNPPYGAHCLTPDLAAVRGYEACSAHWAVAAWAAGITRQAMFVMPSGPRLRRDCQAFTRDMKAQVKLSPAKLTAFSGGTNQTAQLVAIRYPERTQQQAERIIRTAHERGSETTRSI